MELGGNAPFLVFDDADLDAAVEGAMIAKMRNIGEACTSANRFHVAESVAEEFAEKLAERMGALKVGRGTEDGVDVGPLIDADQRAKVAELVDDAVGKGAKARRRRPSASTAPATSTSRPCSPTSPTTPACSRRRSSARSRRSTAFASEEEAIAAANDTEYGLVAYVFTRDLKRALRVCEAPRDRDDRPQPGHGLQRRRPLRRRQAVGHRPRGRQRGHRGVPRDEVRRGRIWS